MQKSKKFAPGMISYLRTATTHIKRQLISGDNSHQFEKATTHIKR